MLIPRMTAQLNTSMASGRSFGGYIEAPIVFRPTYKSVPIHFGQSLQVLTLTPASRTGTTTVRMITILRTKCASLPTRIGSSTRAKEYAACSLASRVLSRPADRMSSTLQLDCYRYQRAELRTSDHRPGKSIAFRSAFAIRNFVQADHALCVVYALFRSRIRTVDAARRAALRKELLQQLLKHSPHESLDAKLSRVSLNGRDFDRTRLPPPSTDQQAWWNGKDGSFEPPPPLPPRPRNRAVTNPFEPNFYADRASMASADPDRSSAPSPRAALAPAPKGATAPRAEETPVGSLIDVSDTESATSPPPTTTTPNPAFRAVKRKPPPAPPSRTGSSASQGLAGSAHSEKVDSHDTGESWQMLS